VATTIDTAKVKRRQLRFKNIDEVLAEVDRIVAADQAGKLRMLGNWTSGQIFAHLAAWTDYGFEGFPLKPPPWFVRTILKMRKKKYLRDGLPAGVKIPGVENGTTGMDNVSTSEGADRLRRALTRLKNQAPTHPSPAFGQLPHDESIQLVLRHSELHLGFLEY